MSEVQQSKQSKYNGFKFPKIQRKKRYGNYNVKFIEEDDGFINFMTKPTTKRVISVHSKLDDDSPLKPMKYMDPEVQFDRKMKMRKNILRNGRLSLVDRLCLKDEMDKPEIQVYVAKNDNNEKIDETEKDNGVVNNGLSDREIQEILDEINDERDDSNELNVDMDYENYIPEMDDNEYIPCDEPEEIAFDDDLDVENLVCLTDYADDGLGVICDDEPLFVEPNDFSDVMCEMNGKLNKMDDAAVEPTETSDFKQSN